MAFFEMNCFSKALKTYVAFNVILPEIGQNEEGVGAPEGTYKTLWLLHGLRGNHTEWMRKTAIERYAEEYQIAVVMPAVNRSWYTDTAYGAKYFTYITEELPQICRSYFKGMSDKREDNMIAGLSMGGYGALKAAFTYPEKYFACASLSGSLDITRRGRGNGMLDEWRSIFYFDMQEQIELEGSCHDLFQLTSDTLAKGAEIPDLYLWCGTEDALVNINRTYRDMLVEHNVKHLYEESEGDHTWKWWDMHITDALAYLLK